MIGGDDGMRLLSLESRSRLNSFVGILFLLRDVHAIRSMLHDRAACLKLLSHVCFYIYFKFNIRFNININIDINTDFNFDFMNTVHATHLIR
jgi:hypothetical protein